MGEEPNHRTERKPDPLPIKHSILYGSAEEQTHVKNVSIFFDKKLMMILFKVRLYTCFVIVEVQSEFDSFFRF